MMNTNIKNHVIEGNYFRPQAKMGIVVARFNEFITTKLLGGAMDCLRRHDISEEHITTTWVPGSFEIPLAAKLMAQSQKFDAIICLGAVIRGNTSHYDLVCAEVSKGIAAINLETQVPTLFGIVTTESIEQAIERAGTKSGNKGYEVALQALEMADVVAKLKNLD